jgi:pimeloyl-ACP methyl ester carboxylesterase
MRRSLGLLVSLTVALPGCLPAQDADRVRVGDVELRYELAGQGPALVLIHGWTHDHRVWDLQAPDLQRRFRVLRYDRRGWGASGGRPDVSMDPLDLERLMDALGIETAALVGHSQGTAAALRFTLAHPERVEALVLYGAGPPEGFGLAPRPEDMLRRRMMREIAREHGLDSLGAYLFSSPLARGFEEGEPGTRLARELWEDYTGDDLLHPRPPSGATERPTMDRLAEVEAPTLVLTGEWEMPYVQVVAEALAYGIPGAERAVVRGGGHAVHLQEPERFTAEVVRFLRGAGVGSRDGSR